MSNIINLPFSIPESREHEYSVVAFCSTNKKVLYCAIAFDKDEYRWVICDTWGPDEEPREEYIWLSNSFEEAKKECLSTIGLLCDTMSINELIEQKLVKLVSEGECYLAYGPGEHMPNGDHCMDTVLKEFAKSIDHVAVKKHTSPLLSIVNN
jgi:hypothetical protein